MGLIVLTWNGYTLYKRSFAYTVIHNILTLGTRAAGAVDVFIHTMTAAVTNRVLLNNADEIKNQTLIDYIDIKGTARNGYSLLLVGVKASIRLEIRQVTN